jgi:hypothetical protein
LDLGVGKMEEAVMGDGTVRNGQVFDVQLLFMDDANRQLTLQAPVLFLPVTSSILGQDVLRQLLDTVGQSELALTCQETTFVLPLISIPGTNQVMHFSDNTMPRCNEDDMQGGGHRERGDATGSGGAATGRGSATDQTVLVTPEEAERQRKIASHQRRLKAKFPEKSLEEFAVIMNSPIKEVDVVEVRHIDRAAKRRRRGL